MLNWLLVTVSLRLKYLDFGGIWLRPLWWALNAAYYNSHCNGRIRTLPVFSSQSSNRKKAILTEECL